MKTNKALNIIMKSVVVMLVVVMNLVSFSSCTEDQETEVMVPKTAAKVGTVKNWTLSRDAHNKGFYYEYRLTLEEKTSGDKYVTDGIAELWADQYDYNIEEKYEVLDVAYSNNGRTGGQVTKVKTDEGQMYCTNFAFPLEDGNVVFVSDSTERIADVPGDSLINVRLVSLDNVEQPGNGPHKTRAAMYEAGKVYTEVAVELTYTTVGLSENYTYTEQLRDTVTRHIMKEDDIASVVAIDKKITVIDDYTENCSFTEVFTMKSGEKTEIKKNYIRNRLFKGIDPYQLIVDNFTYNFAQSYGVVAGGESSAESKDPENWTVWGKTDTYSALLTGPSPVTTSYTLYHERCTYKDSHLTVEFDYLTPEVSENGTNVATTTSDRSDYDKAILTNEIHTLYGGYPQNISEYVNLYKRAKHIINEGWDESSAKKTFTDNSINCEINYVITYSDGEVVTTPFEKSFSRSLVCTSNWTAIEASNSNRTAGATLNVSKTPKSDNANWTWNQENGSITSVVTLAGSSKNNTWESTEANEIKVSYRGKTYSFGTDQYTLRNAASVANGVENGSYTEYKYSDKLEYTFGASNVKNSTAPGLIKVEIEEDPFFPKEWGRLLSATETVAPNETRKDYVYTWSLHFEHGTLPVVVRHGSLAPEWKFEYFSSETDSRFNGGYYTKASKTWINTIANDGKDWMEWLDSNNSNKGNMLYSTATAWGWDEGHQVSGHPSVTTGRHTLTVNNGELKAKDNYLNKAMTDSNVNKNGGWK